MIFSAHKISVYLQTQNRDFYIESEEKWKKLLNDLFYNHLIKNL